MQNWQQDIHTIYCIGLNYHAHAEETGQEVPRYPILFMKPKSAVITTGEDIAIPKACARGPELDYEGELAVMIGKSGKDILAERALDFVAGFAIANDVSARKWQRHAGAKQWTRGKSFDGFCALSSELISPVQVNPQELRITTKVNGEVRQQGSTADMIFSVAEIIAYISQDTTLESGTLILTGTPAGVGVAMEPPQFLEAGDIVEIEISGLGKLKNRVVE